MPLFSLIVPVYNLEQLAIRCLESIRQQSFSDWECVVIDDGSTDGTSQLLEDYAKAHPQFRVFRQPNGGVSAARNAGQQKAEGRYLMFLDGDDTLEPYALEWVYHRWQEHPDDLIGWGLRAPEEPAMPSPDFVEYKRYQKEQAQAYICAGIGAHVTVKLFSAQLVREKQLTFRVGCSSGEDGEYCQEYVTAFFEKYPKNSIYQYQAPLYIICADNGGGRLSKKKASAHEVEWDPEQARGYSGRIMEEYASLIKAMGGWQSFETEEALHFAIQYAKRFAYAVWAAQKLGEDLPPDFWGPQAVGDLLAKMKQYRLYNAYYWPLRLHWKGLIGRMYYSDQSEDKRLYWRVFLLGDLILFRRWNRL